MPGIAEPVGCPQWIKKPISERWRWTEQLESDFVDLSGVGTLLGQSPAVPASPCWTDWKHGTRDGDRPGHLLSHRNPPNAAVQRYPDRWAYLPLPTHALRHGYRTSQNQPAQQPQDPGNEEIPPDQAIGRDLVNRS
ncbi:hypothetical protein AB0M44_49410 [Streptosporangium subroseum]|uniref:hypothetical protein n=1 Tax=Streptosporangium subroseum TaxID=106412 RepID=UPI0034127B57